MKRIRTSPIGDVATCNGAFTGLRNITPERVLGEATLAPGLA